MSSTPERELDLDAELAAHGEEPDPMIGAVLAGRYRVQRIMGQGGMGAVYSARQEAMERDVAIKVLLPTIASDRRATQRFLAEARIAGGLGHPNVVDVYDLGTLDDGRPFLVMPKLHGKSLADVLEKHIRIPPTHTAAIVRAIASALDAMHSQNIIHRDLKPENLFLAQQPDGTDVVKLLDFGLATLLSDGRERLTRAGMIVGTPEYLPPEAGDGRMIDARGDVYSLACIAYEALTGYLPIDGPTPTAQLLKKMSADAPPLSAHGKAYSTQVEAAIARGLARSPEARYQRAGDFADEFVAAIEASFGRAPRVLRLTKANLERIAEPQAASAVTGSPRLLVIPGTSTHVEAVDPTVPMRQEKASDVVPVRKPRPVARAAAAVAGVLLLLAVGAAGGLLLRPGGTEDATVTPVSAAVPTAPEAPETEVTVPTPPIPVTTAPSTHQGPEGAQQSARERRAEARGRTPTAAPASRPEPTPAAAVAVTPTPSAAPAPTDNSEIRGSGAQSSRSLDRERASALASEGTSLLVAGRLPAAVDKFQEATQAYPGNATAWRGLGLAYQRMGRAPEARRAYERYLRLAPNARDADMIRSRLSEL
ncbi:MAG: tetratricopeptide repeat protein [Sandaracinaceae bacterium]|nr:tetratricopeptide repeat protein [Myxococcales bacterium]MCB9657143.1 tetratricopeptide repeat protein [Sandaracinaceae bacterium]